jgi:hypothetical protein
MGHQDYFCNSLTGGHAQLLQNISADDAIAYHHLTWQIVSDEILTVSSQASLTEQLIKGGAQPQATPLVMSR